MKPLSRAVLSSKKSSIRKLFELVLASEDAISLGIGQPDFPTPATVVEGIKRALDEGRTTYAPTLGLPDLRDEVARKFREENGMGWVERENVMVTNGGSQGIELSFASLANPGDEVLLSSPNFISYFYVAAFFGVRVVEVPRRPDFSVDVDGLRAAVTPKTKFVLINTPNNPTGYAYSPAELDAVVDLALERDLYLVSDEVYEKFLYGGVEHRSPAAKEEVADRTVTLNALSKTYAATGLRCGFVAAPVEVIDLMEKYAQYTSAGVNHPTQLGALAGLRAGSEFIRDVVARYDSRRRFCEKRLAELGLECPPGRGAFYLMPDVGSVASSGEEFSTELMKSQRVAVVPGDAFGSHSATRVRISYATSEENLEGAFERIERYLNS
ncbi:MAG: pyridoxal phosphate-dependent aminotransferase [Promethearchaeota archaeon]